jgi:anti-sigma B factor antagonist
MSEAKLTLEGDIELFTLPQVRERIIEVLSSGAATLVLDLGEVSFMDSLGVGLLVATHKRLRNQGGGLVVARASEAVRRRLEITGVAPLFGLDDDRPRT